MILSILPLFEGEEGGALAEGFNLLENLRAKTGNDAFHTSFWLSIVSSPQIRIPALGYIPKVCPSPSKSLDNTILDINGENLGLMVLSLRLMLNDNSVLVNRGALDILCKHFPMSDDILPRNETLSLLIIALQLFQTRDVSLTRRVKSWLQGDSQDQNQYLPNKALQLFIEAIKIIMESSNPNDSQSVLRPYKMLSEALNQIPVDPLSSPKLYTSILICHKNMCLQTRFRNAIGKQINNLFADVHPSIFWSCLNSLAVDCTPLNPDAREIADTLTFYFQNPTITHLSLRGPCSLFLKLCITSLKNSRRDDPLCMHIISLCKLVLCHLVSLDDSVSCPDEDTINTQKHKNKSDVGLESLNGSHHFYVYILDKLVSALYALMEVDSTKVESGSRCAKIISDPCAPSLVPLLDLIHTVIQLISKHIAKEPSEHTYMSKIKTLARTLANFLTDTTSFPVVLSLFKCIHSCILLLSSEKDFKFSDSEHSSIAKGVVKLTWKFFYKSHMVYASKASSIISMLCNIHNPTNIEHHILTMANACKVTDYYGTVEAMAIFISTLGKDNI